MEDDGVSDKELLVARSNKRYGKNIWMVVIYIRG